MRWPITFLRPSVIRKTISLVILLLGLVLASQLAAEPQKRAVIFIDPDVTLYESAFQYPRIKFEYLGYEALGYEVEIKNATEEEIVATIIAGETDYISFFGHGHGPESPEATSSMLFLSANDWKARVLMALVKKYRAEGLTGADALDRARNETQNFGFEGMRNHSCSSLIDTTLAEAFVKPGGTYSGVGGLYVSCPTPTALLSDVSLILDDYLVPLPAPAFDLSGPNGPCSSRRGPADGCVPGSENCIPCPGDNSDVWYDATHWPVPPAQ